jgi:pre-mRNA-splicing factor 38B
MSRSALQKEFLKRQQQGGQPVPPPEFVQLQQQQQYYLQQYQVQQMAMLGMHGMVPAVDPSAYYAPIPLTGDEEDNEGPAATKSNALPMYGNTTNFNINNLLFNNIMENEYFRALYQLRTYHEVIDEIYRSVDHVEPWQTGTARFPSSAFCLLVKFMLMKLTLKQMKGLLGTSDCPNVRAIGFLYLRYTCPPAELYKWYEPYLEDTEEFAPGADKSVTMTIGEYCTRLLTDMQYYGTTLPRIPVPIERKIKVLLLLLEEKKKRRKSNLRDKERGLFAVGAKVRAIYSDDANEPAWYEAVIDSIDNEDTEGNTFWVTFPEYGNTEKVDLGDMELLPAPGAATGERRDSDLGRDRSRERSEGRKASVSRSRSRDRQSGRDGGQRRDNRGRDASRERGDRRREDSRDRRGGQRDDSRDRGRRRDGSGSRDLDRDRERSGEPSGAGGSSVNLLEKVLQSQREASAAVGKNYGQRPTSYKGSLSLKQDRYTARRKSPSPERRRRRSRSRSPAGGARGGNSSGLGATGASSGHLSAAGGGSGGGGVSAEEQAKRMRLLKERYGDASATSK